MLVSAVAVAAARFLSAYLKTGYERDKETAAAVSNMSLLEEVRGTVHTTKELYDFSKDKEVTIYAVGFGGVHFDEAGNIHVSEDENYGFSDLTKPKQPRLFRIEIGGSVPNSKMTAVVILS